MKNKHKKKISIQIQEATKPETNSSTKESEFDFVEKMENYDFSTLYAEYMYDKNCQTSKKIYGFDGLDVRLPTFEQVLQKFSLEFNPTEKEEIIKTVFDCLPKCGLYLFDEACFDVIPDCVKQEFVDIYIKFRRESYKNADKIKCTKSGMLRVATIFLQVLHGTTDMTDYEKEKLKYLNDITENEQLYQKLELEAFKDIRFQIDNNVFFKFSGKKRSLYRFAVLYDFLLRHSELPDIIEELTNLRDKARKMLSLESDEYVGF